MTDSAIWLAMINVCRAVPILFFTLLGGVIADRMERRKLLFTTQFVMMILAFLLAGLRTADLLQPWMAFAIAVGRGITSSFNQPARQSLVSELVPSADLPNAIALNSATMNLTKVIGPAVGGVLISVIGVAGAFYINGASYIGVLTSLSLMQLPPRKAKSRKEGILTELVEGFVYMRGQVALLTLIFMPLMALLFGNPYQTMLTIFAKDVFKVGSTGLGVMQSVAAVGSVLSAIIMASSGESPYFVHKMLLALFGFGSGILVLSFSPWYLLALPALLCIGGCMQTYQTSNNTLLQLKVNPVYRARVLSMLFLQRGLVPLGTMLVGFGSTLVGPRLALGGMAGVLLLLSAIIYPFALPALTRLLNSPTPTEEEEVDETLLAETSGEAGREEGVELQVIDIKTSSQEDQTIAAAAAASPIEGEQKPSEGSTPPTVVQEANDKKDEQEIVNNVDTTKEKEEAEQSQQQQPSPLHDLASTAPSISPSIDAPPV